MLAESFFQEPLEYLKQKFLSDKATEFEAFAQGVKTREQISERFRYFNELIGDKKLTLAALRQKAAQYESFSVAETLWKNLHNYGIPKLDLICNEISGAAMLKAYLPALVTIAEADLQQWQGEYEAFLEKHSKILKELGLVPL